MIYFQNFRVYHTSSRKTSCTVIQVYLIVKLQKSPVKTGERNIVDNNNIPPHLTISSTKTEYWISISTYWFFFPVFIFQNWFSILTWSYLLSSQGKSAVFDFSWSQESIHPSIHEAQHEQSQRACSGIQCFNVSAKLENLKHGTHTY